MKVILLQNQLFTSKHGKIDWEGERVSVQSAYYSVCATVMVDCLTSECTTVVPCVASE